MLYVCIAPVRSLDNSQFFTGIGSQIIHSVLLKEEGSLLKDGAEIPANYEDIWKLETLLFYIRDGQVMKSKAVNLIFAGVTMILS